MQFTLHSDAQADLRGIKDADINAFGRIAALLKEIKGDPYLLDAMSIQGGELEFEDGQVASVLRVQCVIHQADVWRLKWWESNDALMPYRVLYGFFPAGQWRIQPAVIVLAVVDRSQYNYEPQHPITQRVLAAYRDLA